MKKASMTFFMILALATVILTKSGKIEKRKPLKYGTKKDVEKMMENQRYVSDMAMGDSDDLDDESNTTSSSSTEYTEEASTDMEEEDEEDTSSDSEYASEEASTDIAEEETEQSSDNDYILAGSDSRYITKDEVENLSESDRRLAKNEIYARHGRIFDSEDLREYFESKSWYKGTVNPNDFDEKILNEYEKANIDLISSME